MPYTAYPEPSHVQTSVRITFFLPPHSTGALWAVGTDWGLGGIGDRPGLDGTSRTEPPSDPPARVSPSICLSTEYTFYLFLCCRSTVLVRAVKMIYCPGLSAYQAIYPTVHCLVYDSVRAHNVLLGGQHSSTAQKSDYLLLPDLSLTHLPHVSQYPPNQSIHTIRLQRYVPRFYPPPKVPTTDGYLGTSSQN